MSTMKNTSGELYPCTVCGRKFTLRDLFLDTRTLETTCDACERRAVQGPSIDASEVEHLEFALRREGERLVRQVAKLHEAETEIARLRRALADAEERAQAFSSVTVVRVRNVRRRVGTAI